MEILYEISLLSREEIAPRRRLLLQWIMCLELSYSINIATGHIADCTRYDHVLICVSKEAHEHSVLFYLKPRMLSGVHQGSDPPGRTKGPTQTRRWRSSLGPKTFTRSFRLLFFSIAKRNGNNRCRGRQGKATRSRDSFAVPLRRHRTPSNLLGPIDLASPRKNEFGIWLPSLKASRARTRDLIGRLTGLMTLSGLAQRPPVIMGALTFGQKKS